jgi:hypothetical protein
MSQFCFLSRREFLSAAGCGTALGSLLGLGLTLRPAQARAQGLRIREAKATLSLYETFLERLEHGTPVNHTTAIFALGGATLDNEWNHLQQKLMRVWAWWGSKIRRAYDTARASPVWGPGWDAGVAEATGWCHPFVASTATRRITES